MPVKHKRKPLRTRTAPSPITMPGKRLDKTYEGLKGVGKIHTDALFLRIDAGKANDPDTGQEFLLSMTPSGNMLVESAQTRRYFCLSWSDVVRLAQEAGIDAPLEKLTEITE